jgi:hypothetical protein
MARRTHGRVHRALQARRPHPLSIAAGLLLIALYPLLYRGMYAGDGEIHLVYAEHAAHGEFFVFNPGEKSPGVTRPGFMLLGAVMFKVLPATGVPAVVKTIGLGGWWALAGVTYLLGRRLLGDRSWAWLFAVLGALIPGSAYNATIGMENGLFALGVLGWLYLAIRWNWFADRSTPVRSSHDVLLGALLGACCWLRPEGIVFAALAFAHRAWLRRSAFPSAAVLVCLVITGGLVYFHLHQTGFLMPASAWSRIFLPGSGHALQLGPMRIDPAFAIRLAAYFPLTIFFLIGVALLLTRRTPPEHRAVEGFLLTVFWTFFVLYTAVLGAAHLARYAIFLFSIFILVAARGAMWAWTHWSNRRFRLGAFAALAAALATVWSVETVQRLRFDTHAELRRVMNAPRDRARYSEHLIAALGNPTTRPISLAYVEVQARYWLDDRFVVRSLDGRTDPALLKYLGRDGAVDHVGYLKERKVDFVMESGELGGTLAELRALRPGDTLSRSGLHFACIEVDGQRIWRVE